MSRYVPGRGFEPDPRGVNRKDPKAWADYQKRKKDFYSKPLGDHKGPFGMTIRYDKTKPGGMGQLTPRSTSSLTIKSQKTKAKKKTSPVQSDSTSKKRKPKYAERRKLVSNLNI